ncbi:MAG: hypothetical protein KGI19_05045 [Thaumarchaeota archaeon]|nr:hypothetical protein [Nitrososphaerota archaeon]
MNFHLEKTIEDVRGKISFFVQNDKNINILEIKKGFARGGHYHSFTSEHIIISGTLEYREENIETKKEEIRLVNAPSIIKVLPNMAHLLIAIEDVVFAEVFNKKYDTITYPKYRQIVEEKMKSV